MKAVQEKFRNTFQTNANLISSATGRAELIGGHTDYNDGFVAACAIDKSFVIAAKKRNDKKIIMYSDWAKASFEFQLSSQTNRDKDAGWANYGLGVATLLAQKKLIDCGAELFIIGNVPVGAGLSSSAALEVATANALLALNNNEKNITKPQLALLCQQAEHKYALSPCGIMDQTVVINGQEGHALLLDCRTIEIEQLPFDNTNYCIMIFNSMVRHEIGAGDYGSRKEQCYKALEIIQKKYPNAKALRDINNSQLAEFKNSLDTLLFKRASHVVGENERVLTAAAALKKHDMKTFGQMMHKSHCSARDLYQISCEEIDFLVDNIMACDGAFGARLCGGGFGGAAVAMVEGKSAGQIREKVFAEYKKKFAIESEIYIVKPSNGTEIIRL